MKPRTKEQIEKEIKENERFLTEAIDNSLYQEERCAKKIKDQEEHLKKLRAEPCFEDTFFGKVKKAEAAAFGRISIILSELSQATGRKYSGESILMKELYFKYVRRGGD